jgi:hypothetical protein
MASRSLSSPSNPRPARKFARAGRSTPRSRRVRVVETKSPGPAKGPANASHHLVANAVAALRNNATTSTVELKGKFQEVRTVYPPELVTALKGVFGSTREYSFQMHQVLTVQSSAGGSTLGFVAISPTVASYGEWSALQALFDEAKAVSTKLDWVAISAAGAAAGYVPVAMCMAFDEQDLSTDPASTLAVYRLASSRTFVGQFGIGGSGRTAFSHKMASRGWCDTATASPPYSVSPMGGFIGCWVYGNAGLYPVATAVATAFSTTVGRFRCRA